MYEKLTHQIKYKSKHLYPLEIEKIIEEHPQVLEAGVFGRPDPTVKVAIQ
jgi:acyl-coenzyme A synthetase/AMP-(fatty) acid ligase